MTSPSNNPSSSNDDHDGDDTNNFNGRRRRMIKKAIQYSRVTLKDRLYMRELVTELDRHIPEPGDTSPVPPGPFRAALRRPLGARRKPITVTVNGRSVSLLLNPQGRINVEREQWLWDYIRGLIEGDDAA